MSTSPWSVRIASRVYLLLECVLTAGVCYSYYSGCGTRLMLTDLALNTLVLVLLQRQPGLQGRTIEQEREGALCARDWWGWHLTVEGALAFGYVCRLAAHVSLIAGRPESLVLALEQCILHSKHVRSFMVMLSNIGAHSLHVHWRFKLVVTLTPPFMHSVCPVWAVDSGIDVAWIWIGSLVGCGLGYMLEQLLLAIKELDDQLNCERTAQTACAAAQQRINRIIRRKLRTLTLQKMSPGEIKRYQEGVIQWSDDKACMMQRMHRLELGTYETIREPHDVRALLLGCSGNHTVAVDMAPVSIDGFILKVAVEEALVHSCQLHRIGTRIRVNATLGRHDGELQLHVTLENFNSDNVQALSDEECTQLVTDEATFPVSASDGDTTTSITRVAKAVAAANGRFWVSMRATSSQSTTTLHMTLPALTVADSTPTVQPCTRSVPLLCLGLDDDEMCRTLLSFLFTKLMNADWRSRAFGATREEVDLFMSVALGRALGADVLPPADVVLIDEHLRLSSNEEILGHVLAEELRRRGFRGVICAMTAASGGELDSLKTHPAVNACFTKGTSAKVLATELQRLTADNWNRKPHCM
uniref:Uncharacterized protein n=1 Tax=Coccolithus braarudii TaxID=221442 RepID=A0A7S0LGC6_9EUKA|mmetsp:Transcript_35902/g.76632  ORF Transcript_35902/g.76632 Transcript_35902/m.76632 type:complete len:585 (+) Transcript_35902:1-1755(+)